MQRTIITQWPTSFWPATSLSPPVIGSIARETPSATSRHSFPPHRAHLHVINNQTRTHQHRPTCTTRASTWRPTGDKKQSCHSHSWPWVLHHHSLSVSLSLALCSPPFAPDGTRDFVKLESTQCSFVQPFKLHGTTSPSDVTPSGLAWIVRTRLGLALGVFTLTSTHPARISIII